MITLDFVERLAKGDSVATAASSAALPPGRRKLASRGSKSVHWQWRSSVDNGSGPILLAIGKEHLDVPAHGDM